MANTEITSKAKSVLLGAGLPTVIIGERINPTGRKAFAQAIREGRMDLVREEALAQVQQGAAILDVNVGIAGTDEVRSMIEVVKVVSEAVDVPLCIDSSNPKVLAAALEVYQGKALVNSVTGEEGSLKSVLPLIKQYDCSVIGLCMDDKGIPEDSNGRLKIAEKILSEADKLGIPKERIVIDCVTMTVGSNFKAGLITLEAIRKVTNELGLNTVLGGSNVSHGLPMRHVLNQTFFGMAIEAGLTALIMDPASERTIVKAADFLAGKDEWGMNYLDNYRQYHEVNE